MARSRSKFRLRGSLSGQSVAPPSCRQQVRPSIFPNVATPANLAERCISCSGICRDGTNRAAGFPVIQCRECDDASSVSIVASRSAAPAPLFTLSRRRPRVRVPSSPISCQKLTQLHRIRGTSNNRRRFLHIVTAICRIFRDRPDRCDEKHSNAVHIREWSFAEFEAYIDSRFHVLGTSSQTARRELSVCFEPRGVWDKTKRCSFLRPKIWGTRYAGSQCDDCFR